MPPDLRTDELLAELGWVRALTRRLVADAHAAEDVAQETLLRALDRPAGARSGDGLRGWLARVAKNLARQWRRSETSRNARERAVGREAAHEAPPASEVFARGTMARRINEAVLELPEPYASTVLYRYLDGLSTEETAERMDVLPATVRKRLSRAAAMLRERLERDVGRPFAGWAALLLTPDVAPSGPVIAGTTSWVAEKATVISKGLLVTQLSKLAAGVLTVGLVATIWHVTRSDSPKAIAPAADVADDGGLVSAADVLGPAPLDSVPHAPAPERETASVFRVDEGAKADAAHAPFELHVTVVDAAGAPVTEGDLLLRSAPDRHAEWSRKSRIRREPIAGETTVVPFAAAPAELMVRVSIPRSAPVPGVPVGRSQHEPQPDSDGTLARVRVVLGTPFEGPSIHGLVRVDGESRIPANLRIQRDGLARLASVGTEPASYELGPLDTFGESALWVTSDETVPLAVPVPALAANDRIQVDLRLDSSRTLAVRVVDADSGAPIEGVELVAEIFAERERSGREVYVGHHRALGTSDMAGRALLRGLPLVGTVELYAWQDRDRSLARVELDADSPDPVEVTVEVRLGTTRFLGALAPGLAPEGSVHVRRARYMFSGYGGRSVELDEDGRWTFDAPVGSSWRAWLEVDGVRRSRILALEAEAPGERGPFLLEPGAFHDVRLVVEGAEVGRELEVSVREDSGAPRQRHELTTSNGAAELLLRLDGPANLTVAYDEEDAEVTASVRRRVDPETEGEVRVDLATFVQRRAAVVVDGASPAGESVLVLLDTEHLDSSKRIMQWLADGRSEDAFSVPEGSYLWLVMMEERPGFAGGVVQVDGRTEELRLEGTSELHERAELGSGILLVEVAGLSLRDVPRRHRELPWPENWSEPEDGRLRLPTGLVFEVLP